MVAYRFEDSRGGENVERHLAGYTGLLQVDGWGAYNRLAEAKRVGVGGPLQLAACWAHLRRKFYELHVSGVSHVASETVERMAELWKVEERIRGQNPDDRQDARQDESAAIVADLWPFWERELGRISGKSKLAEAIRYARSRREALDTSCMMAASTSTPTPSSGPSAPRQLQERMHCSRAATVAGRHGRRSPHSSRPRR